MFVNNNLSSFKSAYSKSVHQLLLGCLAMASEAAEEKGEHSNWYFSTTTCHLLPNIGFLLLLLIKEKAII